MTPTNPLLAPFLVAASDAAQTRDDVDPEVAREVFTEAATLLHNGLALDGLDEHDTSIVIDGLCIALQDPDPGAAIRACAAASSEDRSLHDRPAVSASYLIVASLLQV